MDECKNQEAPSGSFRETADQAIGAQQGNIGLSAGQMQADKANNIDHHMQQRRMVHVMTQLQALAQGGHSKGIYVVTHKHSNTLSGGIVIVEYGPFTLPDLVSWADKLARLESFSFKFTFHRLDAY